MDEDPADFPTRQFQDDEEGGGEVEQPQSPDSASEAPPQRGFEKPKRRPGDGVINDDEEDEEEDDDDGVDLMREGGNVFGSGDEGDSSEEEEDDPEEARLIAEGFIVDDTEDEEKSDDDEAEKRRKKKRRVKKLRKKKKQQQEDEDDGLDEDDLDLVAENTGRNRRQQRKRFRRGSASPEPEGSSRNRRDLARIFEDDDDDDDDRAPAPSRRMAVDDEDEDEDMPSAAEVIRRSAGQKKSGPRAGQPTSRAAPPGMYPEDDMDDFIDDDDDSDDAEAMADMDEEEKEERRREKRERKKAEKAARRAGRGRFAGGLDPNKAGIDEDAWEEINDIFGDGQDYAWAFKKGDLSEDEADQDEEMVDEDGAPLDGMGKKKVEFKDVFEPAAIQERMLTEADERVKHIDWPERFQLALPGDEGLKLLEAPIESSDLDRATLWVSSRISNRCSNEFNAPGGMFFHLRQPWLAAIRLVLEYVLFDRLEVPFLYSHRSDQLTHETTYVDPATGRPRPISYLTRRELHTVTSLAFRWKTLHGRKEAIHKTFERIAVVDDSSSLGLGVAQQAQFEVMLDRVASLEELSDLSEWLTMRYGDKMRDAQESFAHDAASGALNGSLAATGVTSFKRPSVLGRYEALKNTVISELAKRFGISSTELSENLAAGSSARRYFSDDDALAPEVLAEQFVNPEAGARSAEQALNLAKVIITREISREPMMKREIRQLFKDHAQITVRPTERGSIKIDEEHPFWNFKYLENKPVREFTSNEPPPRIPASYSGRQPAQPIASQTQYLLILQAEGDNLVNVEIELPDGVYRDFEERLYQAFASEGVSEVSQKWNALRRDVVKAALEEGLINSGRIWVREWLKEECSEWLCRTCESILDKRLDARPLESRSMIARRRFPDEDDEEDDREDGYGSKSTSVPSVLAVSHGQGDPRKDAVATVFFDAAGRFRSHATFDHLNLPTPEQQAAMDTAQQAEIAKAERRGEEPPEFLTPRQRFVNLLVRLKPDVIVVNGFSPRTVQLKQHLEALAEEAKARIIVEENFSADQTDKAAIDVTYVHDDTARLYQHSARSAAEFPELKTLQRYCVGLARYAQSPLLEFASLGDDLTAINFDAHQRLVSKDRLRTYLERSIVSCANEVGVDLNKAVGDVYYRQLLPFVCGLGPRKAKALVDAISQKLEGTVVNRRGLLDHQILSWPIFVNAAAFLQLKITASDLNLRPDRIEATEKEKLLPDVLDRTRIHPEDYKYARKMAADALNLDEEDLEGEHLSHPCALLLEDPDAGRRLRELDIDSYADVLMKKNGERKRLTLEQCTDELLRPYGDLRGPFKLPSQDEMLIILTGETPRTLDRESIVNVSVAAIAPGHIVVRLDCGMEGTINEQYLMPMELEEYAQIGQKPPKPRQLVKRDQTLKAQIIDIDKDQLRVELTAKPSHLAAAEASRLQNVAVAVDPRYWNSERAEKDKRQAEFKRQAIKNRSKISRVIKHPNFRNFKAGQAEEFLANQPRGAVLVRPSSKGNDHLAVTWKVDENVYQHLDVLELEKENEYSLGRILRVMNVTYNDLDELIVNHVNPMAKMVEMMVNHEKYKGNEQELDQYLTNWCLANPTRSTYAFGLDPRHPGCFKLGFKANRDAPIQYWPVKVLPGRFKLHQAEHLPDVASLANAFKTQYTAMAAGARGGATPAAGGATAYGGGARTPYGMASGARTPMHAGGMTPSRMAAGGMTPAGGAYGQQPPPGASVYGSGSMTPRAGGYGAQQPPPPPGPPPMAARGAAAPGPPPAFPGPPPSRPPAFGGYAHPGPPPGAPPQPPGRAPLPPPGW
ncbi:hypothetical protein BDZ90DRAFT_274452 [Jaminaea rosea]|uniref:Transcription elongation factor SPT6 n=1 Tax=Jaminaea rosea TaxID=1569628 RepID=A0A316US21_9BASI|nr:hypothetical protein BDZ90DRAFT_274452 [Jaminaea rosea]PWN28109.1 hypothetical protein BDZ90DRAFT_274452 [Jaminaea rosea]